MESHDLLVSKLDFLRLRVETKQHTPLDAVKVYLKNKICFIGAEALTLSTMKTLFSNKSESVYFWEIFTVVLSRLYLHHIKHIVLDTSSMISVFTRRTFWTFMEGNMFWNMVAMSFTCMPSTPKLLRMRSGWWVNCCSCILCLFKAETTSFIREY